MKSNSRLRKFASIFHKNQNVIKLQKDSDIDGLIWIINNFTESESKTIIKAIKALGELGSSKAIDPLIELLEADNPEIRKKSIAALGKIKAKRACQSLIQILENEDQEIQKVIVDALRKIRCVESIPALIGLLRTSRRFFQVKVIDALASFGAEAVIYLNEALAVKNVNVSMGALSALSKMGEVAVDELAKNLEDPDEEVRWGAAYALGKIHGSSAVASLQKALHDPEKAVRIAAVVSLGIISDEQSEVTLAMALGDENADVRRAAKDALSGMGVNEEDALLKAIKANDQVIRAQAAWGLSRISDERSISALLEASNDPHPEVRVAAIQSLGINGPHLGLDVIQSAMLDPDPQVRLAAKKVIQNVMLKIEYLTNDLDTNNKRRYLETEKIIEAFGMITVEPLIKALDNYLEIAEEERNLVESGFHMAHIRADEGSRTRALSEMHNQTAERVAGLLQKITGNYFGMNVMAWKQWWQQNKSYYIQPYSVEE